ncbi:sigma-70 family RNA polymerase sigma factor [Virgibacillus dakarensis]|uniref:sigma-70 family RNA polymerase sigma factor n=1 Tax=Virgibacillus dakarensis TaxID=1917889 RepID=UPI000B44F217|nr:sigma-70 family RNA polymerase sigma factor [Virgibacillus dakarensis]
MDNKIPFEVIFKQNERRIYYHLHKLNIHDPHHDYFQEGLVAMWNAYETYQPDKGPMATYFNFTIRNRLIDKIRKETRIKQNEQQVLLKQIPQVRDGNYLRSKESTNHPLPHLSELPLTDPSLWKELESRLTENQWKWVYYYIACDMSVKDIAIQENTTVEAVKSWGKQVRKKLCNEAFRKSL